MFTKDKLNFSYRVLLAKIMTREAIGELETKSPLQDSSQADNRQSDTIKEALEMLKEVEVFYILFTAAIELPLVQTPSQKSRNSTNQLWIWKVSRLLVKVSQ